ncbi:MAG: putative Ig domain-containing protein, partial [Candidatus Poseidoniaceae archaeon]
MSDFNCLATVLSSTPLAPTIAGPGAITSWAISPALPSGLSFGTSNGTIWGTPTSIMTLKTYTIWGNNSGGSANATVNITVTDAAPNIAYNPDWFVLTNNTAMSPTATPTNSGGAVPSGTLDFSTNVGMYASIAIDSDGFKHVSYLDATTHDLKYATDKSGVWNMTSVDTPDTTGYYSSIAIDSDGAVHISYYSSSNGGDLKYATCSSGCTNASNWNNVTVDTTGNVGWYTSIAIDSNDAVHVSYQDHSNGDLKYATCSS